MRCLVIGGCGFLGGHIVDRLVEKGWEVNVFDIRKTHANDKVSYFIGDLCSQEDLEPALKDVHVVFHCASPPPLSNNKKIFYQVNVDGTKNIIAACENTGVQKLILTSSASVVYEGRGIVNGNEDLPYAVKTMDYYTKTKVIQEQICLEANSETFHTVAIRPHGIFGPRDAHMMPTIAKMGKAGKTKYIIGNGKNVVDFTYVDNVVHGHILAAEQLGPGAIICGKAYFITNDEPIPFWDFMKKLITGINYPEPRIHIPYWFLYLVALIMQFLCFIWSPIKKVTPSLTPFTVAISGTDHFYSCAKAKDELGYKPIVSLEEGIQETLKYFSHLKNE